MPLSVHRATVVPVARERLITAAEARVIFGRSRAQIHRWITEHNVPAVDFLPGRGRTGGTAVYRLSDFTAVAAQRHAENARSPKNVRSPAKT